MDSGEAAIWGAAIGSVGTLVASVIVPIVSGTIGARRRAEVARRAALRESFPPVVRAVSTSPSPQNLEVLARFTMLLKKDEWQIEQIAVAAYAKAGTPDGWKVGGVLVTTVTAWMREEISPVQAGHSFATKTGLEIKHDTFPTS